MYFIYDNSNFSNLDDKKKLERFLQSFQKFILETVENGKDVKGEFLFEKKLFSYIRKASKEVEGYFDYALILLDKVEEADLVSHGLTGQQLNLKLAVVNWVAGKFNKIGGKSLFRRLLATLDTLLTSLLSAIGVGEALSEFKDSIKNSTSDI